MKIPINKRAIEEVLKDLDKIPNREKLALLEDLERLEKKTKIQDCRQDFLKFCHAVYPGFKEGPHHRHLKPKLHNICHNENGRMTVSMPPRMGKSELCSYLFVAWYLGHHADHHIIMVTHTATLSASFGRKIRNLIDTPAYQEIFPDTKVSKDKSAADDWTTSAGGKYLAVGVGGAVAGHGAHLCLDPEANVISVHGQIPLKDLQVGDFVFTQRGWRRVVKKWLTTHQKVFKINDDLIASGNHPFYTQRGWVETADLRPGDRIETATIWSRLWGKIHRRRSLR